MPDKVKTKKLVITHELCERYIADIYEKYIVIDIFKIC